MVGQLISHYRILRPIGAGGMGVVYLAEDTTLGRHVALKILPEEQMRDDERVRRFRQEARAASALNHPNILTIHEVGRHDDLHFIATEYVEGESLRDAITRTGAMPLADALPVAAQVASALAAAHEAGIIHRDVKPENIMIRRDGYAKVLDFGLAKLTERASPPASSGPASAFVRTESGVVLGTMPYMSPEQATGGEVDARSDIFSLGAVLYEMLAGKRPFDGGSPTATVTAILSREPEPLPAAIPAELARDVMRCLRKDPARRFQTMADLRVALEDARDATTPPRRTRVARQVLRRRGILLAAPPLALLAGWMGWRATRPPEPAEPLQAVPLMTLSGMARYPSLSPEGNYVSFTWTGPRQDNTDVYVQQIGVGEPLRVTTDRSIEYNPVWSPDGNWIAFLRPGPDAGTSEVRLVPPLGGPERLVSEIRVRGGTFVPPPYLTWCPDSGCVIVTDSPGEGKPDALFLVSIETGEKRQLTRPEPPASGDTSPAVDAKGRWLVFRRTGGGIFDGQLFRLRLGADMTPSGQPERLTGVELDAAHPSWLPNGREILFSAKGGLWRLALTGERPGTPERLPYVGQNGLMPVVSPAQPGRPSRLVYARNVSDGNIWQVETAAAGTSGTAPPEVAISSTTYDGMADLSPDGRRVAFTTPRTGHWEIWTSDVDGNNTQRVTQLGPNTATGAPRWSPDGKSIVFHSSFEGQPDAYLIPASGGKPRNLTASPSVDAFPSFSSDGRWIYFGSNRDTKTAQLQIWKVSVGGGAPVRVTPSVGFVPLESPDGAWVYYVETMDKPSRLWRVPSGGGTAEAVLDHVLLGNFAVHERGIYYIDRPSGEGGAYAIDRPAGETRLRWFDLSTRRSITVARNLGNVDLPLSASRDGRRILFTRIDVSLDDLVLVSNFR